VQRNVAGKIERVKMRAYCAVVAGIVLFIVPGFVRGNSTNLVYTYSGQFNLRIPFNSSESRGWMQDAVIFVPDHIVIWDLDVLVNIRHTSAFDLQVSVRGPSGRVVNLAAGEPREGYYKGQDYAGTRFDDEAQTSVEDARPPFAGSFRPRQKLEAFDGRDAYGVWTLEIYDAYYGDVGCLDSFALIITGPPREDGVSIPSPAAGPLTLLGLALIGAPRSRRLSASFHDNCLWI
jgi:subtilisin-like proprotein convertase family protein